MCDYTDYRSAFNAGVPLQYNNVIPCSGDGKVYPAFVLFQELKNKNKYNEQALKSIQTPTLLSTTFLSDQNMALLQKQIKYEVYIQSDKQYVIKEQSYKDLKIIARSIYLQHSKNLDCNIKEQIRELNYKVTEECVKIIMGNIVEYIRFREDLKKYPVPLARSQNVSNAGSKTIDSQYLAGFLNTQEGDKNTGYFE